MKNFTQQSLIVLACLFATNISAQVKIGDNPQVIDANSLIELESTNKGALLPRVDLTATNNASPLLSHIQGMIIYNKATSGSGATAVTPGYYYNSGTEWVRFIGSNDDGDGDAWGVTGEDITSEINRTGDVIIGGTAQIGGATPKLSVQNNDSVLTTANITPVELIHLSRKGTNGNKWGSNAQFKLGSYQTNVNSRSSLEIGLTDANTESTYNTVMTLNGNGHVGIGTTNPTDELEVVGKSKTTNFQMTNGAANGYILQSDANGNASWVVNSGGGGGSADGDAWAVTGEDVASAISRTGNVGIGVAAPTDALEVDGKSKTTNFQMTNGATNGHILQSDASGNASWIDPSTISDADGDAWAVTGEDVASSISRTGNVGIGVVAPTDALEVDGKSKTTNFQMTNGATNGHILQSDASGNASWIDPSTISDADGDAWAVTGEDVASAISRTGNVGIGVAAPTDALEVDGKSKTTNLQMTNGATNGHILQSDALGNASWIDPSTISDADGDAWAVTGEDITSEINRTGDVIIGGTAQIGGATPKLSVQNNDSVLTTVNITPVEMIHLSRKGTNGNKWGSNAQFKLGSYQTNVNSRSSLEIGLTDANTESTYNTVMTLNGNGHVGIGTTNPTDELEVVGKSKTTNFQMTNGAANGYILQSDANGNASWVVNSGGGGGSADGDAWAVTGEDVASAISRTGNVGIGVAAPTDALEVDGKSKTTNFQMTNGATNGHILQSDASGNASWIDPSTISDADGDAWAVTGEDVASTISRTGNVGIGVAAPTDALEVDGKSKTTNFQMTNGATNGHILQSDASGNASWIDPSTISDADGDAWAVTGEDVTSEISRTGGVIIGGASQFGGLTPQLSLQENAIAMSTANTTPTSVLHMRRVGVAGNKWAANAQFKLGSYESNALSRSSLEIGLTDVNTESTYNTVMTLNGNGHVGVGTSTPSEKLEVIGSGYFSGGTSSASITGTAPFSDNNQLILENANGGSVVQTFLTSSSPGTPTRGFKIGMNPTYSTNGGISFQTSTNGTTFSEAMSISVLTRNVGIGVFSASYKLEVSDDSKINEVIVGRGSGNVLSNTVVGALALENNGILGIGNTALGFETLRLNTSGLSNTAVGEQAIRNNTTGHNNTAIGSSCLINVSTGGNNTAVGHNSGNNITTGNNNIAIGHNVTLPNATANNQLNIGNWITGVNGNITIPGNLDVTGTISKGGGTFKIDHPVNPETENLVHSFIESPDMMNIYNGNITTNNSGEAIVTMPDYFQAANKEFKYQLTVMGVFAQAIIKEKINNNTFIIATSLPNVEVSWQVTGVRADKWADENRIVPVQKKDKAGEYLHPDLYDNDSASESN